jgi:exopolysaccharide biosynthesis polyprenyl glycosylphosphotransferase
MEPRSVEPTPPPPAPLEPGEGGHHLLTPRVSAPERVEVRSPSWPYSIAVNLLLTVLLVASLYLPIFLAQPPAALAAVLLVPAAFASLLTRVIFESNAALATRRGDAAGQFRAALLPAAVGAGLVALIAALAGTGISLAGVALAAPMAVAVLTVAARLRGLELRVRAGARRVYFIGSSGQLAEIAFEARRRGDMQLVGYLDIDSDRPRPANGALLDEILGSSATVVVLASAAIHDDDLVAVASDLNVRGRRIRVLSHFYEEEFAKVPLMELTAAWFLFDVAEIHSPRAYGVVKRAVEMVLAAALLLLALPLLPVIVLAIKLSGIGPVLFRQERIGKDGTPFRLTKFRTMRQGRGDPDSVALEVDDPRIPPVGRLLRRFRFDELPQLWDVVRGKLSLVGPRPEQPFIVERLEQSLEFYAFRHRVRPGLTGWAQVNHIDAMPEKLQYDFYYVKNQGLLLDLMIIAWTVRTILSGAGR